MILIFWGVWSKVCVFFGILWFCFLKILSIWLMYDLVYLNFVVYFVICDGKYFLGLFLLFLLFVKIMDMEELLL